MNLSETGNANICCTSPKGQKCFQNMNIPWGIICHFVTVKMLSYFMRQTFYAEEGILNHQIRKLVRGKGQGHSLTRKTLNNSGTSDINYDRDVVCSLVMNYEIVISVCTADSKGLAHNYDATICPTIVRHTSLSVILSYWFLPVIKSCKLRGKRRWNFTIFWIKCLQCSLCGSTTDRDDEGWIDWIELIYSHTRGLSLSNTVGGKKTDETRWNSSLWWLNHWLIINFTKEEVIIFAFDKKKVQCCRVKKEFGALRQSETTKTNPRHLPNIFSLKIILREHGDPRWGNASVLCRHRCLK